MDEMPKRDGFVVVFDALLAEAQVVVYAGRRLLGTTEKGISG